MYAMKATGPVSKWVHASAISRRTRAAVPRLMSQQHAGTVLNLQRHFPGYTRRVLVPGSTTGLSGLGFSLKPPKWLRSAASSVVKVVKGLIPKGEEIELPGGAKLTTPGQKTFQQQASSAVESIPGGWITIAGVGLVGLVGVALLLKRK